MAFVATYYYKLKKLNEVKFMHENKEFKLYVEILNYSRYIRKYVLCNIPNVHRDLRIHLMDEVNSLIRNLVSAESTKGNIKMKYITEMIINIKMLDIISSDIRDFCPESKKHINKSVAILAKLKNMTYGWQQNPEPNESTK